MSKNRIRFAKVKPSKWWMLIRMDGSWIGDDAPYLYSSRREALESGWNMVTNPAKPVRVSVLPRP